MKKRPQITLADGQRGRLEDLWFVYGNYGRKYSLRDHKFIQALLERGEDLRGFYSPSAECVRDVEMILSEDKASPSPIKSSAAEGFKCACGRFEAFGAYVFAHYDDRIDFTCPDCGRQYAIREAKAIALKSKSPAPTK